MSAPDDPRSILDREEARARRELDLARERLRSDLRRVVDVPGLVRRHPYLGLLGGAATGYAMAFPLRAAAAQAGGLLRPLGRVLRTLALVAVRDAASGFLGADGAE